MNIQQLKDALVQEGWHPSSLELGIQTGFKCQYCGLDFFSSVNAYDSIEVEHIIPKNPGLDQPSNMTLACRTCNKMKRRWNPALHSQPGTERQHLISTATTYIRKLRKKKAEQIARERTLADQILKALSEGTNISEQRDPPYR